VFEAEFRNLFHPRTIGGIYIKEIVLSATVAFLLGSFVFYRWKYATSKWTWVVGVCGFTLRAIFRWSYPVGTRGFIFLLTLDAVSVRMVFYSLGAACTSLIVVRGKPRAQPSTNI
jgi:hypothetical protein